MTTAQYGDNCMSQRKVYGWVERFKWERKSAAAAAAAAADDDDYMVCVLDGQTVTRVQVKEQIYQRIRDNRRISNDGTASQMSGARMS
jgi:hypothetical protein